jgi:formylglycine-generating enzyme
MILIPASTPYCIDRWESILVDQWTGNRLSPHYPVDRQLAIKLEEQWEAKRATMGSAEARAMPIPALSEWQRAHDAEPKAVSRPDQVPNGYVSGKVAKHACENAAKRLCSHSEWAHACRGSSHRQYPYGDEYKSGACNVFRSSHPAALLHGDASMGHLDPRLLLVSDKDGPLLRKTGTATTCQSRWGDESLFEMVGNLDEWVDDPDGMFVGGFFSRGTKEGCESVIKAHPFNYFDYSLGVRCCMDPP